MTRSVPVKRTVHPLPGPGIEVEAVAAVRWTGDNWGEVQRVLLEHPRHDPAGPTIRYIDDHPSGICLSVDTQIGPTPCAANAWPGDTLVLDAQGRFWIDQPWFNRASTTCRR